MFLQALLLAALLSHSFALPAVQVPLMLPTSSKHATVETKSSELKGKFLHITDFHPDGFYKPYSSTSEDAACHRGDGPAGIFGAETSSCDTPITLVNATFQWINDNIKDEVDFVIWTGDSARHDSDEDIPRTVKEVLELNTMLVDRFTEVFGKEDDNNENNKMIIPVIPSFGNNDVLPHNIMFPGPNTWTKHFSSIWKSFIPEEQRHAFERGGWFYVEVIPHQLAVFSLNTLYFFDSNSAVDGCAKKSEPGYEQMEWLRIQLQFMREKGIKAIMTGHVPPARTESKQSWDETCWQKYALWMQQYRDVVVGSSYGHMNIDHFMLQDFKDIKKKTRKGKNIHVEKDVRVALNDDTLTTQTKSEYLSELRTDWSQIPDPPKSKRKSKYCQGFFCDLVDYVNELKTEWARIPAPPDTHSTSTSCLGRLFETVYSMRKKAGKGKQSKEEKYLETIGGPWGESYALSLVSASVVPNYFPSLRVVEYNISGVAGAAKSPPKISNSEMQHESTIDSDNEDESSKKNKKHSKKKPKFTVPLPPTKGAPPGPAYSPQTFSWLGYTQYYANLTKINNDFPMENDETNNDDEDEVSHLSNIMTQKWRKGKHSGKHPQKDKPSSGDKHHHDTKKPKPFTFEIEYTTLNDTHFNLPDLTMRNYLALARKIGHYTPPKEECNDDDDDDDDDDSMQAQKKKKKHHKGGKKLRNGKGTKMNKTWFTFLQRAFVGAVGEEALREEFGGA